MIFKAIRFKLRPSTKELTEILFAQLDRFEYEGISEEEDVIVAYIAIDNYSSGDLDEIRSNLNKAGCELKWKLENINEQNWNLIWEKNFEPVIIQNVCVIKAPFHKAFAHIPLQIIIEPKMSFGTGHHQTTRLMVEQMLKMDFKNKKVLDMGCGTGVLSILASKSGGSEVVAIDNDRWSYENALENIKRNSVDKVQVLLGGSDHIAGGPFDVILANINRNILLDQMRAYARHTKKGSTLLLSGILINDKETILESAQKHSFVLQHTNRMDDWLMLMLIRK